MLMDGPAAPERAGHDQAHPLRVASRARGR
jgi:hypothetical protein